MRRDIIVFGDDWERHPQTLEHIAKSWARQHRVIWVNSLGHKRFQFSWRYVSRMLEKIWIATRVTPPRSDGITIVKPLTIPFHQYRFVRRLNGWLLERLLKRHMRRLGVGRPVLCTNSPMMGELVGRLNESVVAYYCTDDYPAFPDAFESMPEIESEMLGKTDIAFFVSEKLLTERRPRPIHAFAMSQGVHEGHFADHVQPPDPVVAAIRKPIIGFMGWLTHWVDLDLIHAVALHRPDWSFVWVGSAAVDIRPYTATANMHFVGARSYPDLPSAAQLFDVGLIPFKLNELTLGSNPLKLLEYFAMGIPVVSTPLPEVARYRPLVRIAASVDETEDAIEKALVERGASASRKRRSIAQCHSWDMLAREQFKRILVSERERLERSAAPQRQRLDT